MREKMYRTLLKRKRDAGAHNIWALEISVIHVGRAAQSMWMTDYSDLSTWMTEFSATRMLCSGVTLL
jgi:hypothetical protein